MEAQNVKKIIQQGESQTVEFKENFDHETVEIAVALANAKGGTILIGVSDKKQIKGIQVGKATLKDWVNRITQSTEPRVIPDVEVRTIQNKSVAVIEIKDFPIKPVSCKGKYFRRVGASNRIISHQEITQLHLDSIGMSWDKLPARDSTLEDIDLKKVKRYIQKANEAGRRKIGKGENPTHVLEKLELLKDNHLTWAAMLLFRSEAKSSIIQVAIHCGRFKEKTTVIDDRMIEGTLIEQIEEAMDFIRKNLQVRFVMTGKPAREEKWDYPLEALREALINAVCHRDYTAPSNTEIRIFDDELTIWNPGGLSFGLTMKDLYKPHSSVLRNKGIGAVFYDIGLIEQWGRGIEQMRRDCRKADLPEPVFEECQQGFRVTFQKDIYTEEYLRETAGLNGRQIKAVMRIKKYGQITSNEYQKMTKVSKPTATRDFALLSEKQIVEKIGITGRGTSYTLKKKGLIKGSKGS